MKKKKKHDKKKADNNTSVINVGKLMRQYSNGMNISQSAVHAMINRIEMFLEVAMPEIAEIAKRNGCKKTIKEHEDLEKPDRSQAHITIYFNSIDNDIHPKINMISKKK